jgi:DNA polymerase
MLQPLTIDFETYYSTKANGEYSLTWMTAEEYVRDPRFQVIGFSLKWGDQPSQWYSGSDAEMYALLHSVDWSNVMAIGHNMSEFDSLILTERYGIRPRAYACTLQMARALHAGKQAKSLEKMCELYGLPPKGKEVLKAVDKRREDFSPYELAEYGAYCGNSAYARNPDGSPRWGDADLTWELFKRMAPAIPRGELQLAHLSTRMFAEPKLALDLPLLQQMQLDMAQRKQQLLLKVADILNVPQSCDVAARTLAVQRLLRKDHVLADVLTNQYDLQPPMKDSPKKRNPDGTPVRVYAFAKTDEGMDELLNFDDPDDPVGSEEIQALAAARLGVKSTLAESRVARFVGIAERGMLPVALAFGKTHTHRLAGSQKINMQNLSGSKGVHARSPAGTLIWTPGGITRLNKYNKATNQLMDTNGVIYNVDESKHPQTGASVPGCHVVGLRDSIVAPPGKRLVVADSSQIELRVCHLLAGQLDTVEELRAGIDVYSSFASTLYGRPITKADKKERQHGKVGMLQLQYQAGGGSFRNAARVMGGVRLTEDEAYGTVDTYRNRFTYVRQFWEKCRRAIVKMSQGGGGYIDEWGLCQLEHNRIVLPGRMPLVYENLRQEMLEGFGARGPEMQWVYDDKEKRMMKKIYGGSVTENLCQWIARHVVFDQMLECERKWGNYNRQGVGVALTVHDEIVLVVDEDDADECLRFCLDVMSQPPVWWPQLPVKAEGGIGQRYSEAK